MGNIFALLKRLPLTKAIIPGTLLLLGMMVLRRCDREKVKEITSEELKTGERAAIITNGNTVTIVEAKNGVATGRGIRPSLLRGRKSQPSESDAKVVTRIDGARGIRVSVGESGNVSVTARTRGFCFEPGFGTYTTSEYRRIFIDAQFLFARRHGVNAGIGLGLRRPIAPTAFIAYSYNFYSNTSLLIGYDTRGQVLVGARVKF